MLGPCKFGFGQLLPACQVPLYHHRLDLGFRYGVQEPVEIVLEVVQYARGNDYIHILEYVERFAYLAAVVRGQLEMDKADLSSLETNLTVARILDAARKSAATGKTIVLKSE